MTSKGEVGGVSDPASAALHIVYRTCSAENQSRRPVYYSKALCAASLRLAMEGSPHRCDLTLIQDGPQPSDAVSVLAPVASETIITPGLGNSGSLRQAFELARSRTDWTDDDLVYFVEDDYLHTQTSLCRLTDAWHLPDPVGYLTLYEHPNAYASARPDAKEFVYFGPTGHWRTITSTCMTFVAKLSSLRRDFRILTEATRGNTVPLDYPMWLAIQGPWVNRALLRYYWKIPARQGVRAAACRVAKAQVIRHRAAQTAQLVAPLPSEATHLDLSDGLAPGVDWASVAVAVSRAGFTQPLLARPRTLPSANS